MERLYTLDEKPINLAAFLVANDLGGIDLDLIEQLQVGDTIAYGGRVAENLLGPGDPNQTITLRRVA